MYNTIVFLCLFISMIAYILYSKKNFKGFTGDALDYFQIAREITENKSFTTKILRPWRLMEIDNFKTIRDISRGPIFPLYLAVFFRLFGANDKSAKLATKVLHLAIVFVSISYCVKFNDYFLIIVFVFSITLNGVLIKWNVLGYSESLAVLLLMVSSVVPFLSLKLIMLSMMILIKPTYLIFGLYFIPEYRFYSVCIIIPFILWSFIQRKVSGTWKSEASMIILFNTIFSESEQLYWRIETGIEKYNIKSVFSSIYKKVLRNTLNLLKQSFIEYGEWIILCIILKKEVIGVFFLYIIGHAFFHSYIRYLSPLFIFITLVISQIIDSQQYRYIHIIILSITIIRFIIHYFYDNKKIDFELENLYIYQILVSGIDSNAIITDIPWATAWYTNKLSIQLPESINDIITIMENVVVCETIYFSPMARWRAIISKEWQKIIETTPDIITFGEKKYKLEYKFSTCGKWDGRYPGLIYRLIEK